MHSEWIVAAAMAIIGALLFMAFVYQDIRSEPDLAPDVVPWVLILRYSVAMTLAGMLSGLLFRGLFGRSGIFGWILAFAGGIVATSLSGLFGSGIGLLPDLAAGGLSSTELVEIAAGLLILPLAASEQPWLLAAAIVLIVAAHLLRKRMRYRK